MQIDFHHGVTYVIARLAGFEREEAEIIAYSAQYVDDALCDDAVMFTNGAIYKPTCSAHRVFNYKNFDSLANHLVWIPFHFLPGNCPAREGKADFTWRVVCRANSSIAKDMIAECIRLKGEPHSLHRLGVTMHVYADTWAHKGFSGIQSKLNSVEYFRDDETSKDLLQQLSQYFAGIFEKGASRFVDGVIPLGHGAVLSYPDRPYLKWRYTDYTGRLIKRDNPSEYVEAANNMYIAMMRYIKGDAKAEIAGLDGGIVKKLHKHFSGIIDWDKAERHKKWLEMISKGEFGFKDPNVAYIYEGPGSWEYKSLGGKKHSGGLRYPFNDEFMKSDWKKFHDALAAHYHYIVRILLPYYGLCVA